MAYEFQHGTPKVYSLFDFTRTAIKFLGDNSILTFVKSNFLFFQNVSNDFAGKNAHNYYDRVLLGIQ